MSKKHIGIALIALGATHAGIEAVNASRLQNGTGAPIADPLSFMSKIEGAIPFLNIALIGVGAFLVFKG